MPWRESCTMDQRMAFIGEWLEGLSSMVELTERYGNQPEDGLQVA